MDSKIKAIMKNYNVPTDKYEEWTTYKKLLLQQGKTILETHSIVNELYKLNTKGTMINDSFYHMWYLIITKHYNITINMPDNLPDNLQEKWEERFKEREEMVSKKNKSYKEIEEFICNKYNIEYIETEKNNLRYDIILILSSLNKPGRPSLPSYLKEESVKKNRQKMKDKMTDKYEFIKEAKKNLLTEEEIVILESKLEGYDELINKLSFFRIKETTNAAA
jgi:hypothetical protein